MLRLAKTVGKADIVGNQPFLLLLQCFLRCHIVLSYTQFSSVKAFNQENSIILSFGKEIRAKRQKQEIVSFLSPIKPRHLTLIDSTKHNVARRDSN